jgi:hypothetical protein
MATLEKRGLEKFAAYMSDHSAGPDVWVKEGSARPKMHWTISTVGGLCYWCGISPSEAWNMAPGEAQWLLAAAIDQSPDASIDLVTPAHREAIERLRQRKEAA